MLYISAGYSQELHPDEKNGLLVIMVVDYEDNPIDKANVSVRNFKTGTSVNLLTNSKGICEALVPIGHKYTLDIGQVKEADIIEIPDEANFIMDFKLNINREFAFVAPSENININISGVGASPVSEKFEILSLTGRQVHKVHTDSVGQARIWLPTGQSYQVNFDDAENYMRFSIPEDPFYVLNVDIQYEGSGKGKLYPTIDKILVGFHYFDLDSVDVVNEKIAIRGGNLRNEYEVVTDETGWGGPGFFSRKGRGIVFQLKYWVIFREFQLR